jgi:NTP pyrophosphatase (non-canonical NTP hydrolase)
LKSLIQDPQQEALTILAEECAELAIVCSKIQRFGLHSNAEGKLPETNLESLVKEMGDVAALCEVVCLQLGITTLSVEAAKQKKQDKLKRYSHLLDDQIEMFDLLRAQ